MFIIINTYFQYYYSFNSVFILNAYKTLKMVIKYHVKMEYLKISRTDFSEIQYNEYTLSPHYKYKISLKIFV